MSETRTAAELMSEYDVILVLDKSGSMSTDDMPSGMTRWKYVQESVESFTREACKVDSDGIGIVLFSGQGVIPADNCDVSKVRDIFSSNRPGGSTPLHLALEAALKLAGKSDKKDVIVIVTDGEPDDKAAAERVIASAVKKQTSDDALTFLFIQVGYDTAAKAWLKTLDDGLQAKLGLPYDAVDVKTIDEAEKFDSFSDLLVAALND